MKAKQSILCVGGVTVYVIMGNDLALTKPRGDRESPCLPCCGLISCELQASTSFTSRCSR